MCCLRICSQKKNSNVIKENQTVEEVNMDDKNKIAWLESYYQGQNLPIQEINLIGIRDTTDIAKDIINDTLGYWTKDKIFLCRGTTDPSVFYTLDKASRHPSGTFHLDNGWHEKIWRIGTHKGYEALVNKWDSKPELCCKPTRGWRDANYNFVQDVNETLIKDWVGVNLHRMHETVLQKVIGKYSAGCQVVQDIKNFRHIIDTVKSTEMYKKQPLVNFNYMMFLINEVPIEFLEGQ